MGVKIKKISLLLVIVFFSLVSVVSAYTLYHGWNLAASPYEDDVSLEQGLSSLEGCYQYIFSFQEGIWMSYSPLVFFNNLDNLSRKYGYWVKVNCSEVNWEVVVCNYNEECEEGETIENCPGDCPIDENIILKAEEIGDMYNCPSDINSNAYIIAGNVGYSYMGDEATYALAKLLDEKNCNADEKYVILYVATVNFPSNGTPNGVGADIEQKWLDYWDYTVNRYSELGYKIIIHPMPFIVNDYIPVEGYGYPPGLRPLIKSDLNLDASEIPVVYECRDGRKTKIASIYDPRTLEMGVKFYEGLKIFFSKYGAFVKISIVPPSDFGEYGFPFGVPTRWWYGSDSVGDCYLTGDVYARAIIPDDPPSYELYDGKLNEFRAAITAEVKRLFPDKRYMIYFGYGSDYNPRDGFQYEEVVEWEVNNGVDLHSAHAGGFDWVEVVLGEITINKPENYEFIFENFGWLNEYRQLKSLYHAAKYGVTGLVIYADYIYDYPYLYHLVYSMGSDAGAYADKGITFADANGLGAFRSSNFVNGYMDVPTEGATVDGDDFNMVGGWGFFDAPYGDHQNYGVKIYAGHLIEGSTYQIDVEESGGKHPEYMRLVGSTITTAERAAGLGDTSRFGFLWKPNMAKGKAVFRIFFVNSDSEIIAEHPHSPMIINIDSKIEGSASLTRTDYNFVTEDLCDRMYRMAGTVINSESAGMQLEMVIIDEYRGKVLALGETDGSGNFDIEFEVDSNEKTQFVVPRAYVYIDNELIALQTNLGCNVPGHPKLTGAFLNVLVDCEWDG